jgi:hypothetical protein
VLWSPSKWAWFQSFSFSQKTTQSEKAPNNAPVGHSAPDPELTYIVPWSTLFGWWPLILNFGHFFSQPWPRWIV